MSPTYDIYLCLQLMTKSLYKFVCQCNESRLDRVKRWCGRFINIIVFGYQRLVDWQCIQNEKLGIQKKGYMPHKGQDNMDAQWNVWLLCQRFKPDLSHNVPHHHAVLMDHTFIIKSMTYAAHLHSFVRFIILVGDWDVISYIRRWCSCMLFEYKVEHHVGLQVKVWTWSRTWLGPGPSPWLLIPTMIWFCECGNIFPNLLMHDVDAYLTH